MRGLGKLTHTEEVVAVQMYGVGNRRNAVSLLNEPVVPRSRVDSGHQIDRFRVAGVTVQ